MTYKPEGDPHMAGRALAVEGMPLLEFYEA